MNELSMQEVLRLNKIRYTERLQDQRKQIKKEQRKEGIIVIIASMLILGLLFKVLTNLNNDNMERCLQQGYSQNVCEMVVR